MSLPPTYKPSLLSYGTPRTSPFRRPESPASPSTTIRPLTPTSPTKPHTPLQSPSKLQNASTPISNETAGTHRGLNLAAATAIHREAPPSPTRDPSAVPGRQSFAMMGTKIPNNDAVSRLPPAQVREMREAFQILDRDGDGLVNRDDVIDMLTSLGLDTTPSTLQPYFPPSFPTLSLPTFLSTIASLLAPLSSTSELLSAFSAFDDDDSGQIDVSELRDALLHTSPGLSAREVDAVLEQGGFVGRRAFAVGKKGMHLGAQGGLGMGGATRGEVFRYGEFVNRVMGGEEGKDGAEKVGA